MSSALKNLDNRNIKEINKNVKNFTLKESSDKENIPPAKSQVISPWFLLFYLVYSAGLQFSR